MYRLKGIRFRSAEDSRQIKFRPPRRRQRHTGHCLDIMDEISKETTVIDDAWDTICSFDWLLTAHSNARKGKRYRSEILTFSEKLEDWLFIIMEGMKNGSYELGPYKKIWVYVPKKRLVMALPYPDRIVQWSLYQYLNPFYDKKFIEDSYACRRKKGSHMAARRLQYWLRQVQRKPGHGYYYLKLDISKYFYRVNHDILLDILSERIKDENLLGFIRSVVNCTAEPFGLPPGKRPQDVPPEEWLYDVGMPIGNLTSQLFANIYLNELDQFCKHKLRIHYYIRYMDDIVILAQDKQTLHTWKTDIEAFLRNRLSLELNDKTAIRPVRMGVEFVGIRIWNTHAKLRKSTVHRIKKEVKKISRDYANKKLTREGFERRVASINGMLAHTDTGRLRMRLNDIYQTEIQKAKRRKVTAGNEQPFANNSGLRECDRGTSQDDQDPGNTAR